MDPQSQKQFFNHVVSVLEKQANSREIKRILARYKRAV